MDTLFTAMENDRRATVAPLAVRMRPRTLDEVVGQGEAVGEGSWLRAAIENDSLSSVILFGPAGTGKTSLAHVIAESTRATFVEVSAIGGTVSDLRREIDAAEKRLLMGGLRTILFVDEIHRFNRSQQDALLHAVEDRLLVLVGATTENPFFEVNSALISRSRVVELHSLSDDEVAELVGRAVADERGLAGLYVLEDAARDAIVTLAGGDGRGALTTLELAAGMVAPGTLEAPVAVTEAMVRAATPHRALPYDKNKDMHYDIISAFIKSMRGSDPDAAVYWLARMIDGGEDPKFIARRMFIAASEDIGNADPQALLVAEAAFRAAEVIGYPECRINLAQAAIYLALAPKSNAAEAAIDAALSEVRHGPARKVPDYLRDRHRPGSEHYGEYQYPHSYPGGWVDQRYLPDGLERGCFYQPSERGWEAWRIDAAARDRGQ
ncbi:replication-associated recombination protein A [Adlercreutzia muris]|jgi:putative ATPase|uniref:replication-associated recombination protein A n=1 Tax=Adlercreutzia muris TaxID=1796610 RepID=UPI00217391E7|nr:replication-associated recombination protein A [Adlercreutzia muris]MCI8305447.1 replication-associated recombination protein A [Enterorhabdus sp.]MCI9673543.1 replication-associated recombination protein A [Enterorhabdus sp.]MCU7584936.1 replication-associated recombination protein A [Adlercreutzia muris]